VKSFLDKGENFFSFDKSPMHKGCYELYCGGQGLSVFEKKFFFS